MILTVLDGIKTLLENDVSQTIKLPASGEKGREGGFNLVHPRVLIEWVDQVDSDKSRYPEIRDKSKIPCLLVCVDEAEDSADDLMLNIRIAAVCWNPGTFSEDHEREIDGSGYYDLVNLLERAKHSVMMKRNFGTAALEGGVRLQLYGEQPYPYWYGWLSFQARSFGDSYVADMNF